MFDTQLHQQIPIPCFQRTDHLTVFGVGYRLAEPSDVLDPTERSG